jgi:hypothetical protein
MPNLGNFGQGLPALLGVALGIRAYTGGLDWLGPCVAVLILAVGVVVIGRFIARNSPVVGGLIIEAWIVSPIIVTALMTAFIVWLSALGLPHIFGTEPNEEIRKSLASTLVGAVTAYAALVWTKDISDGTGIFWPSTQFKAAMAGVQRSLPEGDQAPLGVVRQAMFSDEVQDDPKIVGWGFNARRARARKIDEYVRSKR